MLRGRSLEGLKLTRQPGGLECGIADREIPEPWLLPPACTALEMESGVLGSEVQEILGADEVIVDELASSLQLQWAAQAEFPNVARPFELHCCAIPLTAAGGGGICAVPAGAVAGLDLGTQGGEVEVLLTGGPSEAAHHSDSCVAVLVSQLEIVSEVPAGATWFTPDGRLPHVPSSVLSAAWDERCGGVGETPGSVDGGQARLSFPVAQAGAPKGQRSVRLGIVAPLPMRQADFQATMLAHVEGFADRLPAFEVTGLRPFQHRAARCLGKVGRSPALHEARTLLGAGAGISRIRLPVKPVCAVPAISDAPSCQTRGLAEVLAKLASVGSFSCSEVGPAYIENEAS